MAAPPKSHDPRGLVDQAPGSVNEETQALARELSAGKLTALTDLNLKKAGLAVKDVDVFEINEAFAMVTMLTMQALNLPHEKVNIYGGTCAQGHPIGSTGSRLIVTLAHALQQHDKQRGIAALCIGGGEATAVALERA